MKCVIETLSRTYTYLQVSNLYDLHTRTERARPEKHPLVAVAYKHVLHCCPFSDSLLPHSRIDHGTNDIDNSTLKLLDFFRDCSGDIRPRSLSSQPACIIAGYRI